jgi:AraC-type DNA-binding domain-containing proteins
MDDRLLALQMVAWMEGHLADQGEGQDLVAASGYSENRLRQKFFSVTGETPSGYLRKRRLTEAARRLMAGADIVDVALSYGYSSQDSFTTAFKAWFGLNPGELKTMDAKYRRFLSRMKEPLNVMELTKLKQSPLNTTLMGCVQGASEYFELDWSVPKLFGYSAHAFLVNVHKELCPCSPYTWNHDRFYLALRDMGMRRTDSVCLQKDAGSEGIDRLEERIKAQLDAGKLCVLDFMEHQLIAGYDAKGFVFLRPWPECAQDVQLPALSFGTWAEAFERESWVQFTFLEKEGARASEHDLLCSALTTALRMRSAPADFEMPGNGVGEAAWANWIAGVERGLGTSHGHWWTGTVWAECRTMAAEFFGEVEADAKGQAAGLCRELSAVYRECASRIDAAKERSASAEAPVAALTSARDLDGRAAGLMKELLVAVA